MSGNLCIAVFTSAYDYIKEKAYIIECFSKSTLQEGSICINMSLSPGTYCLTVHDDEDGDGKMRYNVLGIPREGFGFSNLDQNRLRRPSFDEISFTVDQDEVIDVNVKMRYY